MPTANDYFYAVLDGLPEGHESVIIDGRLSIDWDVDDDERPNRRSRRIVLGIAPEFIDDHENDSETRSELLLEQIEMWAAKQYKRFDPTSEHERNQPAPIEEWHLSDAALNELA